MRVAFWRVTWAEANRYASMRLDLHQRFVSPVNVILFDCMVLDLKKRARNPQFPIARQACRSRSRKRHPPHRAFLPRSRCYLLCWTSEIANPHYKNWRSCV